MKMLTYVVFPLDKTLFFHFSLHIIILENIHPFYQIFKVVLTYTFMYTVMKEESRMIFQYNQEITLYL